MKINYPFVVVDWIDSYSSYDGWVPIRDLDELSSKVIRSVGWIVKESDDNIMLAPNFGDNPDQVAECMVVPKKCLVKMTRLNLEELAPNP